MKKLVPQNVANVNVGITFSFFRQHLNNFYQNFYIKLFLSDSSIQNLFLSFFVVFSFFNPNDNNYTTTDI